LTPVAYVRFAIAHTYPLPFSHISRIWGLSIAIMAGNGKHSPIPATTEHHSYSQHHGSDTETGQDNINVTRNKSDGQQHAGYRKAGQDQINLSPQADDQRQYFTDSNCAARQNETPKKLKEGPVGWGDLPQRRQLFILAIARLSEPLVQTSLQVSRPSLSTSKIESLIS